LPDLLEQLLLFNDSAPILDQVDQQIERSGLQRLRLIALQDPEVLQIHYYVIEIIAGRVRPSGRLHRSNSSGSFGFLPGHRKITVSSELHHYRRDEFDYSRDWWIGKSTNLYEERNKTMRNHSMTAIHNLLKGKASMRSRVTFLGFMIIGVALFH